MTNSVRIPIDDIPLVPSFFDVLSILDVPPAAIIFPNKKSNPTDWRWFNDVMQGQRKNPQISKLMRFFDKHVGIPFEPDKLQELTGWESFCEGQRYGGIEPCTMTFSMEVTRIEQMVLLLAQQSKTGGRIKTNFSDWDFLDIPCFHAFIQKSDSRDIDRIRVVKIILLLYLLLCWEVDEVGDDDKWLIDIVIPIRRNSTQVRPMRRWMEAMRDARKFSRLVDMYDCLLTERSTQENPDTRRRVAKRWWQNGEPPSWKLVPRIVESLQNCEHYKHVDNIEWAVYNHLAVVRLLDYILLASIEISNQCNAWEDPLALFADWPELRRLAQTKRPNVNIL